MEQPTEGLVDQPEDVGGRRRRPHRRRTRIGAGVLACVAALGVAACGSSSNNSSSSTSASSSAASAATSSSSSASSGGGTATSSGGAAKGSPIDVYTIGPFTSAGTLNFEEQEQAAKAAVSSINASGGINGHPLKLTTCDDQFLPNKAVSCYQSAAQDSSVVAEVGGYQLNGDAVKTIVDSGKLPVLEDTGGSAASVSDPNWFTFTSGQNNLYYQAGAYAAQLAGKGATLGVIDENLPTTQALVAAITAGAKAEGAKGVDAVSITQATVDLTSTVSKLISEKPTAFVGAITSLQTNSAIQLLRQSGFQGPAVIQVGIDSPSQVKQLFSYPHVYGVDQLPPPMDTSVPCIAAFDAAIKKYQPSTVVNSTSLQTWLGFLALKDVADKIQGPITRASLTKALNNTSTLDTQGITPAVPGWFTKPGPIPATPRIFNTGVTRQTYAGGKLTWDGKFYPGYNSASQ
jgi:branched-chain amino acid transport system substrate-binding protein